MKCAVLANAMIYGEAEDHATLMLDLFGAQTYPQALFVADILKENECVGIFPAL